MAQGKLKVKAKPPTVAKSKANGNKTNKNKKGRPVQRRGSKVTKKFTHFIF